MTAGARESTVLEFTGTSRVLLAFTNALVVLLPLIALTALAPVDLTVAPGRFVSLIGPSGCGKTTIAKLISRMYDPVRGSVTLDGVDLRRVTEADLRRARGRPSLWSARPAPVRAERRMGSCGPNLGRTEPSDPTRSGDWGSEGRASVCGSHGMSAIVYGIQSALGFPHVRIHEPRQPR